MAGRGPLPKEQHQRERDTRRRQADAVALSQDDVVRGPDLVEATGRRDWHERTLAWYRGWQTSAQAQLFQETDWSRLVMLADLVDEHHTAPKKSAATFSEIRLNEAALGATYADRRRERINVTPADPADAPSASGDNVVSMGSRREQIAARMKRAAPQDDAQEAPF